MLNVRVAGVVAIEVFETWMPTSIDTISAAGRQGSKLL